MESSLPLCSQVLRDGVIGVGCSDGCLRVFDMVNMVVVKVIKARARARARGRDGHGGGTTTGGGMQGGGMQGGGMQGGGGGGGGVVEGMVSLVLNNISRSSGIVVSPQLPLSAKLNFSLLISPSSHSTPPSASSSTGGTLYLYSLPLQPPAIIDDSGPYAKIEGLRGLNYNEGEGGTKGVPWVVWDGENAAKKEGGVEYLGWLKRVGMAVAMVMVMVMACLSMAPSGGMLLASTTSTTTDITVTKEPPQLFTPNYSSALPTSPV